MNFVNKSMTAILLLVVILYQSIAPVFASSDHSETLSECQNALSSEIKINENFFYDTFFHSQYRTESTPHEVLFAAQTNPELRNLLNQSIANKSFAKTVAEVGLKYRRWAEEFIARPSGLEPEFYHSPMQFLWKEFKRLRIPRLQTVIRPPMDHVASLRAMHDVTNTFGIDENSHPDDLIAHPGAYDYYRRQKQRYLLQDEPQIKEINNVKIEDVHRWLDAHIEAFAKERALLLKEYLLHLIQILPPIYIEVEKTGMDKSWVVTTIFGSNIYEDPKFVRLTADIINQSFVNYGASRKFAELSPNTGQKIIKIQSLQDPSQFQIINNDYKLAQFSLPKIFFQPLTSMGQMIAKLTHGSTNLVRAIFTRPWFKPINLYRKHHSTDIDVQLYLNHEDDKISINLIKTNHYFYNYINRYFSDGLNNKKFPEQSVFQEIILREQRLVSTEQTLIYLINLRKAKTLEQFQRQLRSFVNEEKSRHKSNYEQILFEIAPSSIDHWLHSGASSELDLLAGIQFYRYLTYTHASEDPREVSNQLPQRESQTEPTVTPSNLLSEKWNDYVKEPFNKARRLTRGAVITAALFTGLTGMSSAVQGIRNNQAPGELTQIQAQPFNRATNDGGGEDNEQQRRQQRLYTVRPLGHGTVNFQNYNTGAIEFFPSRSERIIENFSSTANFTVTTDDDYLVTSNLPVIAGENNRIVLPIPEGTKLRRVHLINYEHFVNTHSEIRTQEELPSAITAIYYEPYTSTYSISICPNLRNNRFTVQYVFEKDPHYDPSSPRTVQALGLNQDLNRSATESVNQELRNSDIDQLADSLDGLNHRNLPITVFDLENTFANLPQIYSHQPESLFSTLTFPLRIHRRAFDFWERFTRSDGRLYYECDGANSLFAEYLNFYFFYSRSSHSKKAINITSLTGEIIEDDDAAPLHYISAMGHMRTIITDLDGTNTVILDATPRTKEAESSFLNFLELPKFNLPHWSLPDFDFHWNDSNHFVPLTPAQISELPLQYPELYAIPLNSRDFSRPRSSLDSNDELRANLARELAQRRKNQLIEVLRNLRIALRYHPSFRSHLQIPRNKSSPIKRAYALTGQLLAFTENELTIEKLIERIHELYPSVDFNSLTDQTDLNKVLSLVHQRELNQIQKIADFSKNNRSHRANFDPELDALTTEIYNTVVKIQWDGIDL